ncbi:polysaccharide lyase 6 family protein [Pontibacter sp. G13]|uniref:polysaccharide lyase 6 family protein n=1 Tax=Pontibacter sp. G13 TaxID=3074898 RepID=UPI0028892BE9|nr:polysaccharide lyase 6 family protein [Pontibacter sp. G13]WNJ20477.1 polysaccharide lyase 6 family protein [Pontibacter sp. G13]
MLRHLCIAILGTIYFLLGSANVHAQSEVLVKTVEEFHEAAKAAQPGTTILLANGVWEHAELVFQAQGTPDAHIYLRAETPGKVFLEGESNLRIAGEYLEVSGLVFRNGHTPTEDVISFRRNSKNLANHCRVTECVIHEFNNPDRHASDRWVSLYGKHNRLDHCYLVGKRNRGVMVAVRLNSPESQENQHQIDHNYFGPRPNLGSNGGETLRIGTSHYCHTNSRTVVEHNFFDRCNGEVEVISNKSGNNTYRRNTFFECRGTLTMRHGDYTTVEENVFIGNGMPHTGGIRVINQYQTIRNNIMYGLTGKGFRSALAVMNGVPNSPANRYVQVLDAHITGNALINCANVQLCVGSDSERSLPPSGAKVTDNMFLADGTPTQFTTFDDISGITFEGNEFTEGMEPWQAEGFKQGKWKSSKIEDMPKLPKHLVKVWEERTQADQVGVAWYPHQEPEHRFGIGKVIEVLPGENTLFDAAKMAQAGDKLMLKPGRYELTKIIKLNIPLTIQAADEGVEIFPQRSEMIVLEHGGSIQLQGLAISGEEAADRYGNTLIRTSKYGLIQNYKVIIDDCLIRDLDVNHTYDVVRGYKDTFADSLVFRNCVFRNVSGSIAAMDAEFEDLGIYNAERVVMDHCWMEHIGGAFLRLYRGGTDESTSGPTVAISNCALIDGGHHKKNRSGASLALHGVQVLEVSESIFMDIEPIQLNHSVGSPYMHWESCGISDPELIQTNRPDNLQLEQLETLPTDTQGPNFTPANGQAWGPDLSTLKTAQR